MTPLRISFCCLLRSLVPSPSLSTFLSLSPLSLSFVTFDSDLSIRLSSSSSSCRRFLSISLFLPYSVVYDYPPFAGLKKLFVAPSSSALVPFLLSLLLPSLFRSRAISTSRHLYRTFPFHCVCFFFYLFWLRFPGFFGALSVYKRDLDFFLFLSHAYISRLAKWGATCFQ